MRSAQSRASYALFMFLLTVYRQTPPLCSTGLQVLYEAAAALLAGAFGLRLPQD